MLRRFFTAVACFSFLSSPMFAAEDTSYILPHVGVYQVQFQSTVEGPTQLQIRLNGIPMESSVVGSSVEGNTQIVGMNLIETTSENTVLEIINLSDNSPVTMSTPTNPNSASLLILKVR